MLRVADWSARKRETAAAFRQASPLPGEEDMKRQRRAIRNDSEGQ